MECREVRPLVDAFLTEQLLVETTQSIVAHLEGCSACRAEMESLRRLRAATRGAFSGAAHLEARPAFLVALSTRLRAEGLPSAPAPVVRSHRAWLAIAASVLLFIAAGAAWRQWSRQSFDALIHAAVGDHRFCALTYKLTEDPITLEEAAVRYDGFYRSLAAVEPPDAALGGGTLRILERHSCIFGGERFAHLVLQYKGTPVSLLVSEAAADAGPWVRVAAGTGTTSLPVTDGFHVESFREARHVVFVVSSLGNADVRDVARAMVGPVARAMAGA